MVSIGANRSNSASSSKTGAASAASGAAGSCRVVPERRLIAPVVAIKNAHDFDDGNLEHLGREIWPDATVSLDGPVEL